jgi:hypothetical protein
MTGGRGTRYSAGVRTFLLASLTATVLASAAGLVHAHVAPAMDANNRYLKLTPMRDRVRLAYTVYIGEIPGAQARRRMDENGDGTVSARESEGYGKELAASVVKELEIIWDGEPHALAWSEILVGLGTPATNAGSFSVDLIGWICGQDRPAHTLVVFDRYRIPRPGETEVRVQATPGIKVLRSMLGREGERSQMEYKWEGNDGPMATLGYYLEYKVSDEAALPPGQACEAGGTGESGTTAQARRNAAAMVMAAILIGLLAGLVVWRRKRPPQDQDQKR